jgi:hypothetical protein
MVDDITFYSILSGCYFVGGLTLGYYFSQWKNRKRGKKAGTGRWDWTNRRYTNGDDDGAYFK